MDQLTIRPHTASELEVVLSIHKQAFGSSEEAGIVADLLSDPTAQPIISLVAELKKQLVGHILLTAVQLEGASPSPACSILAPLAVLPEAQGQTIGQQLIKASLDKAREAGQSMVFVLGHPTYYPKGGFQPAGRLGLQAAYPILKKNAGAWMVAELAEGSLEKFSGTVKVAAMLDKPEYWRE